MLDRFISIRKALIYSILISKVKDMKKDVLQALKAYLKKIPLNCVLDLAFNIFQKKKRKVHRVYIACYDILTIEIDIFDIYDSILSNLVVPFISYLLLLKDVFKE
jgi:hypothetical protein